MEGNSNGRAVYLASGGSVTNAASASITGNKAGIVIAERNGTVVNFEGNIRPLAEQMAGLISCQVVQGLGEKTSGSVENFALTRLSCPSVTMLLTREETDRAAWARNSRRASGWASSIRSATTWAAMPSASAP